MHLAEQLVIYPFLTVCRETIEAKHEGYTLTGVEGQSDKYANVT